MARAFLRALIVSVGIGIASSVVGSAVGAVEASAGEPADVAPPAALGPPWLGVSMDAGGDIGVKVERVVRGSPADKSGVRRMQVTLGFGDSSDTFSSEPFSPGDDWQHVSSHAVGRAVPPL